MDDSTEKPISLLALEDAVAAAGSQTALGEGVGKSQGHVAVWLKRGRCASDVVLKIEELFGVSRHRLRGDIFGAEPKVEAAE